MKKKQKYDRKLTENKEFHGDFRETISLSYFVLILTRSFGWDKAILPKINQPKLSFFLKILAK